MKRFLRLLLLAFLVVCVCPFSAICQGIQQSPYSAANTVRGNVPSMLPDSTPFNRLGLPGGDTISISSAMFQGILPNIPNLQIGYNYTFGPRFRAGNASIDYLVPFNLGGDSTVYGEAHGEFQSLSIDQPGSPNNSVELCLGGGYRRMFGNHTMIGLHSFFDTTKLYGLWYSSGSVGAEMAAMVAGHDAIDLNFNWYGKSAGASSLTNSLAYNPATGGDGFGNANFDFQAGYSHELYDGGPDLRLSITGYKFDADSDVYGYYAGAELKSRNGVFVLKYDAGYDNTNQAYQSVGAFMNIGFQLENLVAGTSPFVMPKPVFQSPREMTRLTEAKVTRNWRRTTQTAQIALLSAAPPCTSRCLPQRITVVNQTGKDTNLFMGFNIDDAGNLEAGGYTLPGDFPGWTTVPTAPGQRPILTRPMKANTSLIIDFPCTRVNKVGHGAHIALSVDEQPWTGCINYGGGPTPQQTQAEFGLCDNDPAQPQPTDAYDISLVNGFSYPVEITTDGTGGSAKAPAATGNSLTPGVYGWGWTCCSTACPPLACQPPTPGEAHPPHIDCNLHQSNARNYTVYFGGPLP